jgi:hypothetical protein
MKVSLHLEGTQDEIARQVSEFLEAQGYTVVLNCEKVGIAGTAAKTAEPAAVAATAATGKRARKPKEAPAKEETFGDDEEKEGEETDDEDDALGLDAEDEEPEIKQSDVVKACREVVKADASKKEKVRKLLGKFQVTSVIDLKSADYPKFLAQLKKL